MRFRSWFVLVSVILMVPGTLSQDDDTTAVLKVLPKCAVKCVVEAYAKGICALNDRECSCTSSSFQGNVTICVSNTCTVPEALFTKNVTSVACKAPIRDRSHQHNVISRAVWCLSAIATAIRFVDKIIGTHAVLAADDYIILAAFIFTIPSLVITELGTSNGLGKDIWTLRPDQITSFARYFWCLAWLYFLMTALTKMSMLFFYLKIFPSQAPQRILWFTLVFTFPYGAAFVITAVVQCRPISYNWTKWDGLHEGHCINISEFTWANAALNITLDFWMLAIPLWKVYNLRLSAKKKVAVGLMFFVGTFVTVISIIRLHSLVLLSRSSNITWDYYDVTVWSTIEVCIGVVCACMPAIRLAIARISPIVLGNTMQSKWRYGRSASINAGKDSGDISSSTRTAGPHGKPSTLSSFGTSAHKSENRRSAIWGDNNRTRTTVEGGLDGYDEAIVLEDQKHRSKSGIRVFQERTIHVSGGDEGNSDRDGDGDADSRLSNTGDDVVPVLAPETRLR